MVDQLSWDGLLVRVSNASCDDRGEKDGYTSSSHVNMQRVTDLGMRLTTPVH